MSSPTSHRHKRPFQPPITSFFARADRGELNSAAGGPIAVPPLQGPALPHHVQSSLLAVGMRIRKAVPEGYKTHKTALLSSHIPAFNSNVSSVAATSGYGYSRPRELVPYCGLDKIGGLSAQPVSAQGVIDIFADNSFPFNGSQESITSAFSTDSMPAAQLSSHNWNKRRFEDEENELQEEEEEEEIPTFHFDCSDYGIASNLSTSPQRGYPVSHTNMPDLSGMLEARSIAKPRSRRTRGLAREACPTQSGFDFDDAVFLIPSEDEEMEISGT